jgi:hypothetical protein
MNKIRKSKVEVEHYKTSRGYHRVKCKGSSFRFLKKLGSYQCTSHRHCTEKLFRVKDKYYYSAK